MKALLFIPFFLFSFLFAQEDTSYWSVGIQFGAGSTYRTLEPDIPANQVVVDILNQTIRPTIGLNAGLTLGRRITDKFWIETGLQIQRLGNQRTYRPDTIVSQPDPSLGEEVRLEHQYFHLSIPLLAKVYTNDGPFLGFLFLGPQVNFSMNNRLVTRTTFENGEVEKSNAELTAPFVSTIMALVGGAGVSISLNEKLDLEARFMARRDIMPHVSDGFDPQLYYAAGNLGLNIKL